ncbi:MAG TPA: multidrug transporter MatE [Clostridiales bacterium]|nr:multidrug transporter MatE [Clostridiales bacterium]
MSMKRNFFKYVIPSVISLLFTGIYVSVDGLFVGRAVGDAGIAAINIAWPIAAVILAAGTGLGMGGAINISHHLGAGRKDLADKALGNTMSLLLIASALLTVTTLVFSKPLLRLMGAEGELLELGYGYLRVIGFGAVLQVMGTGITPLLRNQNKAWLAMVLMIINFVIDTVLSGVFVMVLGFGVVGAAGASLIGQVIALIPACISLFSKENRVPRANYLLELSIVKSIFKVGASPFGLFFIPSLTIVIINWQALAYGGTAAVAAYAVVSYILSTGQLLLEGIGDGCQPLISFEQGAGNLAAVRTLRKWTYQLAMLIGLILMLAMFLLTNQIPVLFGVSETTATILHKALPLCGFILPLYAITRTSSSYFYAIKNSFYASILIYSEILVILPISVLVLPLIFDLAGVWIAMVFSQLILLLISILLIRKSPLRNVISYS